MGHYSQKLVAPNLCIRLVANYFEFYLQAVSAQQLDKPYFICLCVTELTVFLGCHPYLLGEPKQELCNCATISVDSFCNVFVLHAVLSTRFSVAYF